MSVWIRAICTKSLGPIRVDELRGGTEASDFYMMAEMQGLQDEVGEAAEEALRFEGPPGELEEAKMFYRPENPDGLFVAISRWRGERAHAEAGEVLQELEGASSPAAERIRDVLARSAETVAFCLKESDANGMGWPIAWYTALWLADQGEGLVESEGHWWEPVTYKRIYEPE